MNLSSHSPSLDELYFLSLCIDNLHSNAFFRHLSQYIHIISPYEEAAMTFFEEGRRPIYLFDNLKKQRHLLFESYLLAAFQNDPFYIRILNDKTDGVFRMDDLPPLAPEYRSDFYSQSKWHDEINITVQLTETQWLMISLGHTTPLKFTSNNKNSLIHRFKLIKSLCKQYWLRSQREFYNLSPSPDLEPEKSVKHFAKDILTVKEHQVMSLLLDGLSSEDIGSQLNITLGTVKVHRRRIYTKLQITSISQLYTLFVNYMAKK